MESHAFKTGVAYHLAVLKCGINMAGKVKWESYQWGFTILWQCFYGHIKPMSLLPV